MNGSSSGLNPAALVRLQAALEQRIASGLLPGVVLWIERRGVVALRTSLGWQDPARAVAMRDDTIFRIYSMTKPIVSVALMMLVEQGRVQLRDPVATILPEFADVRVGIERSAPRKPMTVHDLLRHTAGLSYAFLAPSPVRELYAQAKLFDRQRSNAELAVALAQLPLAHQPGTVWDYSHATDLLGRVVEVIGGAPLGELLDTMICEPLGMVDTGFALPATKHARLAEPLAPRAGSVPLFDPRVPARLQGGGGALLSSAPDYARFARMLLNGGTLDGTRLLGRKTVEFMTADHLGALPRDGDVLPPDHGFGLGFAVKTALGGATEPGSIGSYGWSGAAGTAFFVDPSDALFALLMVQAPEQFDPTRELFRLGVYAAIDD